MFVSVRKTLTRRSGEIARKWLVGVPAWVRLLLARCIVVVPRSPKGYTRQSNGGFREVRLRGVNLMGLVRAG